MTYQEVLDTVAKLLEDLDKAHCEPVARYRAYATQVKRRFGRVPEELLDYIRQREHFGGKYYTCDYALKDYCPYNGVLKDVSSKESI
jgi:hypothetical protein